MPYLDDDMGELFLKASENIRLRAESDDWEKIQKKLLTDHSASIISKVSTAKRMNFRKWATFYFILIITGAAALYIKEQSEPKIEIGHSLYVIRKVSAGKKLTSEFHPAFHDSKSGHLISPIKPQSTRIIESQRVFEPQVDDSVAFDLPAQRGNIGLPLQFKLIDNTSSIDTQSNIPRTKSFYVGIVTGPQFSQTKNQGFSNAGLSAGLLAGFHVSNRLAIECALIVSNKQYTSSGQYFDMSKISGSMPSGMKLIQVQSNSTVLEIPVKAKYDMFKLDHGIVFVTGGLSSYILTSENNEYNESVNGNSETMRKHYSTRRNYFASAINFSTGYEWIAGKNVNLRIEPYLQIPLKSIGMGSMHVVSTGIYLGITFPVIK